MMNDSYIEYQTAVMAKGLGYDNGIYGEHIYINQNLWYTSDGTKCIYRFIEDMDDSSKYIKNSQFLYPRPTQHLLAKWLREEHNIYINIENIGSNIYYFTLEDNFRAEKHFESDEEISGYENTMEQALFKSLQYLIIKENE